MVMKLLVPEAIWDDLLQSSELYSNVYCTLPLSNTECVPAQFRNRNISRLSPFHPVSHYRNSTRVLTSSLPHISVKRLCKENDDFRNCRTTPVQTRCKFESCLKFPPPSPQTTKLPGHITGAHSEYRARSQSPARERAVGGATMAEKPAWDPLTGAPPPAAAPPPPANPAPPPVPARSNPPSKQQASGGPLFQGGASVFGGALAAPSPGGGLFDDPPL
eukprot:2553988-Rhodomonas_salina.1